MASQAVLFVGGQATSDLGTCVCRCQGWSPEPNLGFIPWLLYQQSENIPLALNRLSAAWLYWFSIIRNSCRFSDASMTNFVLNKMLGMRFVAQRSALYRSR